MEERKGHNSLAGNSLQKSLIKNPPIKKVQGPSQLEMAALHGLHVKDLYAEPSPGSSLEPNSVTPWLASVLLRGKLQYLVAQWFYLQWLGATQTAGADTLGEHKSKSVLRESSHHLGVYSTGVSRDGTAYIRLQNGFEDTGFEHQSYENEFWLKFRFKCPGAQPAPAKVPGQTPRQQAETLALCAYSSFSAFPLFICPPLIAVGLGFFFPIPNISVAGFD